MLHYTINSENSTDHWIHFNVSGHNVLDLGCGRWYTTNPEECSPIYFGKIANKVVGIDSNSNDITFYINETKNNSKFTFNSAILSSADQIRNLIKDHSITALKCDIEGGEVLLLDLTAEDLTNITELAIEFHSEDLKQSFIKKTKEWGFVIKVKANFKQTPDFMGVLFCCK